MSYQVYARKYRPQSFDEVLGQEAVNQTLKNAITLSRLHQAYLFCGARGVGKTSLARIFAKSLNCEKGPTITPCQQCAACKGITSGSAMDVLEIDGASNTGVDDVRELREQVKYLPLSGKYKIYIIDEVHMLSTSAFNALLKTLEEPPAHVLFIFATTEPHKIPITILSRCQKFEFRRMNLDQLVGHLKTILAKEEVVFSDEILFLIARCADGSVRDSLSLLDQVVSFCGKTATVDAVREVLGLADRQVILDMLQALMVADQTKLMSLSAQAYAKGTDLKILAEGLLETLYEMILIQNGGVSGNTAPAEAQLLQTLSSACDSAKLLTQFQILSRGVSDIAHSEFPRMIFDVTLVRLMRAQDLLSVSEMRQLLEGSVKTLSPRAAPTTAEKNILPPPSFDASAIVSSKPTFDKPTVAKPAVPKPTESSVPTDKKTLSRLSWTSFVQHVLKNKPQVGSLLEHGGVVDIVDHKIILGYQSASALHAEMLKDRMGLVLEMATLFFSQAIQVEVRVIAASAGTTLFEERELADKKKVELLKAEALANPSVRIIQDVLGAKVKEIKPLK